MSFNKIILVGNLGKDPELRYTPQGTAVCNLSVATSEKRRDKNGEMQDETTWFRVTLWDKRAETASKYLTKGSQVYIEGRLRIEEWTDRENQTRHSLEVNATDMQFIGSGSNARVDDYSSEDFTGSNNYADDNRSKSSGNTSAAGNSAVSASDDDIPF